jgi:hypothetical protein
LGESAAAMPPQVLFANTLASLASMVSATRGLLRGDRVAFDREIAAITARASAPDTTVEERARLLFMLGGLWRTEHTRSRAVDSLDRAIALFERAYALGVTTVEPFAMFAARELADAHWTRRRPGDGDGDGEKVIEWGFRALRAQAHHVLLHEDPQQGALSATTVAADAHRLAHRCVALGRLDRAVAAVEGGRALAIHSTISDLDVGAMLRALGHETVALEWERNSGTRRDSGIPDGFRARVLGLLAGTEQERRLLDIPTPADIAAALRETGADALVYLVAATEDGSGCALIVDSDGTVGRCPLPLLDLAEGGAVDRYLTVLRQLSAASTVDRPPAVTRWRDEMGELIRWAWPAVVDPVLTDLERRAGTPRVVLVPCGVLGVVPWHAALGDAGGTPHFAVQRAVFSYAASARQLADVAGRPAREVTEDVVVVANPTGFLPGSRQEARYLHEHCYPHGMYFGALPAEVPQDAAGTPDDVLAQLPDARSGGASLLHLACHAESGATTTTSHLTLADGETLTVAQVLAHSRGRPRGAPGGLVVLAACQSDVSLGVQDEALTMATAFLAAGAGSVVGTRWAVGDLSAAALMCLLHRHLTADGMTPADALRAAQLWAIDPDAALPADIAEALGAERPAIPVTTWAAFSHQGR